MNKKKIVLLIIVVILLVPLIYTYSSYHIVKVSNQHVDEFSERLMAAVDRSEAFDMADVATFEWDRMMVFYPYTSRDEMEEKVGREWTTYSYLGYYLVQKTFLGDYPLDDDSYNKVLLIKGEDIVLDATFNRRQVDLTHIQPVIQREEAQFDIEGKVLKQKDDL